VLFVLCIVEYHNLLFKMSGDKTQRP
jgi:hypothetical protein